MAITITNGTGNITIQFGNRTVYVPKPFIVTYKAGSDDVWINTGSNSREISSQEYKIPFSELTFPSVASASALAAMLSVYSNDNGLGGLGDVVRIQDGAGSDVASVTAANALRSATDKVLLVQNIDDSGGVFDGGVSDADAHELLKTVPVIHGEVYESPQDFIATYASPTTLTITGAPFTVDDTTAYILAIIVQNAAGEQKSYINAHNGISITSSSNVITVAGYVAVPFVTGSDQAYRVIIAGQKKSYDPTTDATKTAEIAPLNNKTIAQTLVDSVNLAAATVYYPSEAGLSMDGFKDITIQGICSGGVTTTFEASLDDAVSPDWIDVTKAGYDLLTNATGASSYIDNSFLIDFSNLNVWKFRIKSITSDATNAVQYNVRQKAL